jgi:hypothetical protein
MSMTKEYIGFVDEDPEEMPSCCGLAGMVFGHKFQPRFDQHQDYPDNTVEAMRSSLDKAIAGFPMSEMGSMERIAEAYQNMDTNFSRYVHDICVRCGLVVRRVTDRSEEVTDRLYEEPAPTWPTLPAQAPAPPTPMPAPTPAPAPTPVQATKPRIVLAQPQQAQQMMNVPPGAQGSAVKAVPGRGPK